MKILFVLENYIPHIGGGEILFQNLCEGLVKLGHDVSIVTHRIKGTKKFEVIDGVKVYRINCFHSRYWFTFLSIPKIISLARKSDFIHTTKFNGAPPAWIASKLTGKKCVITVHEVWIGNWKKLTEMNNISALIHDLLERIIHLLPFDKYMPISNSTKKQLLKIGVKPSKIEVIYPGVDYKHWNPKKYDGSKIREKLALEKNFVYVFTGRPGVSKGLEYLIKAVPLISKKIPNSKLLAIISKDKTYKKRYEDIIKLIEKLDVKDKIMVHNPVSYKELPNYIQAADCVVVPSLAEGFGYTAAEACAMQKPVVASDTTSLPEVVSGRYVLIKPKNPESIAKGVEKVYKNRMVKSKIKKFETEEATKKYLKIYKEIIKKRCYD